ncbi:hypothetical protein K461DRAFT_290399 [Myriangium duriaei CBS 260.36]|uniref:Uncharacterized protein n=1 Tax=Myriangium duriaei CBS 260.36 TaxID=1168546 RepID=A0A9P4JA76_9PEZI|nr:hypothetical protein K461DRAFT_290399 [Myriangium duriaei CBS 260.36]
MPGHRAVERPGQERNKSFRQDVTDEHIRTLSQEMAPVRKRRRLLHTELPTNEQKEEKESTVLVSAKMPVHAPRLLHVYPQVPPICFQQGLLGSIGMATLDIRVISGQPGRITTSQLVLPLRAILEEQAHSVVSADIQSVVLWAQLEKLQRLGLRFSDTTSWVVVVPGYCIGASGTMVKDEEGLQEAILSHWVACRNQQFYFVLCGEDMVKEVAEAVQVVFTEEDLVVAKTTEALDQLAFRLDMFFAHLTPPSEHDPIAA